MPFSRLSVDDFDHLCNGMSKMDVDEDDIVAGPFIWTTGNNERFAQTQNASKPWLYAAQTAQVVSGYDYPVSPLETTSVDSLMFTVSECGDDHTLFSEVHQQPQRYNDVGFQYFMGTSHGEYQGQHGSREYNPESQSYGNDSQTDLSIQSKTEQDILSLLMPKYDSGVCMQDGFTFDYKTGTGHASSRTEKSFNYQSSCLDQMDYEVSRAYETGRSVSPETEIASKAFDTTSMDLDWNKPTTLTPPVNNNVVHSAPKQDSPTYFNTTTVEDFDKGLAAFDFSYKQPTTGIQRKTSSASASSYNSNESVFLKNGLATPRRDRAKAAKILGQMLYKSPRSSTSGNRRVQFLDEDDYLTSDSKRDTKRRFRATDYEDIVQLDLSDVRYPHPPADNNTTKKKRNNFVTDILNGDGFSLLLAGPGSSVAADLVNKTAAFTSRRVKPERNVRKSNKTAKTSGQPSPTYKLNVGRIEKSPVKKSLRSSASTQFSNRMARYMKTRPESPEFVCSGARKIEHDHTPEDEHKSLLDRFSELSVNGFDNKKAVLPLATVNEDDGLFHSLVNKFKVLDVDTERTSKRDSKVEMRRNQLRQKIRVVSGSTSFNGSTF